MGKGGGGTVSSGQVPRASRGSAGAVTVSLLLVLYFQHLGARMGLEDH